MDTQLQEAIATIHLNERLQEVCSKHGLHLDQLGALEKEVRSVLAGETDRDDFVAAIESSLGIDTKRAIAIAADVNIDVFTAIREAMIKGSEPHQDPAPDQSATSNESAQASREEILAEIENPSPVTHPISTIGAKNDAVARNFISDKLSGMTGTTVQKAVASAAPAAPQPAPKPKSYSVDPYREPIA